jgi:glycosyltransferase involved in cell wall biosynthesis
MSVSLSVVVSSRDRCDLLAGTIESLLSQTADPRSYEIIAVDNGSSDATPSMVREFEGRTNGRVRYVFEPRQGVSYGRNAGIAAAVGELIGFTDDDVRVQPEWLAAATRVLRDAPGIHYVGGPVLPLWEEPPPAWLTRQHWAPIAAVDHGPQSFDVPDDRPVCLVTANLFVRRAALNRVGCFNPAFRRCQDRELMLRLWKVGLRGRYAPDVVAFTLVPRERLQRRYHRWWHAMHGGCLARMPLRERRLGDRWLVAPSTEGRFFCGAPLFEYRALFTHAANWIRHRAAGRAEESFLAELQARYSIAFLLTAMKRSMTTRDGDPEAGLRSGEPGANGQQFAGYHH